MLFAGLHFITILALFGIAVNLYTHVNHLLAHLPKDIPSHGMPEQQTRTGKGIKSYWNDPAIFLMNKH